MNTRRQALYYLPGLISLVLLPLFFGLHLWQRGVFKTSTMVQVYCQRESAPKNAVSFNRPVRLFSAVNFNGLDSSDQILLAEVTRRVKGQVSGENIRDGLHIQLGRAVKYQLYIQLLDILQRENRRYFQLTDHGIWVWYALPEPGVVLSTIKPILLDDVLMPPFEDWAAKEAFSAKMRALMAAIWPSWVLLLLLFLLSFVSAKPSHLQC